jgi:hypothetical protein
MATTIPFVKPLTPADKTALVREALHALRSANAIDEREGDLDPAGLVAWYDLTIPAVTDIKAIAGAMDIELSRRRGELIGREGERRGPGRWRNRATSSGEVKVSQRDTLIGEANKQQRKRDRAIAAEPEAVKAYVQEETAAQRVPSKRGAVRVARKARAARGPVNKAKKTKKTKTQTAPRAAFQAYQRAETARQIEAVRDKSLTTLEIAGLLGVQTALDRHRQERARTALTKIAMVDGVVVMQDDDRWLVTVTPERVTRETALKALYTEFEKRRAEVKRRREEARDKYKSWRPDNVHTLNQSALVDWIEDDLLVWLNTELIKVFAMFGFDATAP